MSERERRAAEEREEESSHHSRGWEQFFFFFFSAAVARDDFAPTSALRSRLSVPSLSTERRRTSHSRVSAGESGERKREHALKEENSSRFLPSIRRRAVVAGALRENDPPLFLFAFSVASISRLGGFSSSKQTSRDPMRHVLCSGTDEKAFQRLQELQARRAG